MNKTIIAGFAVIALNLSGAANAATITDIITVSASGFTPFVSGTAPVDPLDFSFSITFDPSINYVQTTSGVNLISSNVSSLFPFSFSYDKSSKVLRVGSVTGGGFMSPGTFDALIDANGIESKSTLNLIQARYFTLNQGEYGSISGTASISSAPLPAALPLFGSAILGLGALARRRAGMPAA